MVDPSIHDQLQTADVSISKASSTIKVMIRQLVLLSYGAINVLTTLLSNRMHKQRILLSIIGVFFVVLVGFILYFKLVR